jgi:hypothetical protein
MKCLLPGCMCGAFDNRFLCAFHWKILPVELKKQYCKVKSLMLVGNGAVRWRDLEDATQACVDWLLERQANTAQTERVA